MMNENEPISKSNGSLDVLQNICLQSIKEQRRARRWGIFFKLLLAVYVLVVLIAMIPGRHSVIDGPHTAWIQLHGTIGTEDEINARGVRESLHQAFENQDSRAVILEINSPGGSPVQAGQINDEIYRLKGLHPDKPVYAVVSDICASGGYYIAVAADKIFVDKASIVGSIGVILNGFGFVEAMQKLGVERRIIASGRHKAMLDPFSPPDKKVNDHVRQQVQKIHDQFVKVVERGRGDRLLASDEVYSGLFWTGEEAINLGLADDFGTVESVARELIGEERLVDYSESRDLIDRIGREIGIRLQSVFSANTPLMPDFL